MLLKSLAYLACASVLCVSAAPTPRVFRDALVHGLGFGATFGATDALARAAAGSVMDKFKGHKTESAEGGLVSAQAPVPISAAPIPINEDALKMQLDVIRKYGRPGEVYRVGNIELTIPSEPTDAITEGKAAEADDNLVSSTSKTQKVIKSTFPPTPATLGSVAVVNSAFAA